MTLNKHAKAWVAALRSGRYKQGKHLLTKKVRGETRHCCLGVACQLFIKAGGKLKTKEYEDHVFGNNGYMSKIVVTSYGGKDKELPPKVKAWLGLKGASGQFNSKRLTNDSLAAHNDEGTRFKSIADLIVKHKDSLFRKKRA